jgi:hypothetical protein
VIDLAYFSPATSYPGIPKETVIAAKQDRYGPTFVYDEFLVSPSKFMAVTVSTVVAFAFGLLSMFSPIRWLAKRYGPKSGDGPSEEYVLVFLLGSEQQRVDCAIPSGCKRMEGFIARHMPSLLQSPL